MNFWMSAITSSILSTRIRAFFKTPDTVTLKVPKKMKSGMFIKKVTPNTIIEKSRLKNGLKNSKWEEMS